MVLMSWCDGELIELTQIQRVFTSHCEDLLREGCRWSEKTR